MHNIDGPELTFEQELAMLFNKHSVDNDTHTPDFVLAKFIVQILIAYGMSVEKTLIHKQMHAQEAHKGIITDAKAN